MIHINLKNNQEIREYINTMPPGRDAYYFIEKAVHDMIVPLDTMLILIMRTPVKETESGIMRLIFSVRTI